MVNKKCSCNNEEKIMHNYLTNYINSTGDDWNYITPEQLYNLDSKTRKKLFLLDVRLPGAFKKGHIKGAINIFWMDILKPRNLKKLPKNKKIIIICYVGHTASQALVMLRLLGFNVAVLKFGMGTSPAKGIPVAGWTNFGFETVK